MRRANSFWLNGLARFGFSAAELRLTPAIAILEVPQARFNSLCLAVGWKNTQCGLSLGGGAPTIDSKFLDRAAEPRLLSWRHRMLSE